MSARNVGVAVVLTVFSVVIIVLSLQLEESPAMIVGDSMQPRAFPIFLMVINLLLVALLCYQNWGEAPKGEKLEGLSTWGSIGLIGVFYGLTVYVDMFVGIAVVMFFMCLLWGERRIWIATLTAVLTPALVFALFDLVLKVRFPRGLLTNWYYG